MRAKKAKMLRKVARKMSADMGKPQDVNINYKLLKKVYKANKGQI